MLFLLPVPFYPYFIFIPSIFYFRFYFHIIPSLSLFYIILFYFILSNPSLFSFLFSFIVYFIATYRRTCDPFARQRVRGSPGLCRHERRKGAPAPLLVERCCSGAPDRHPRVLMPGRGGLASRTPAALPGHVSLRSLPLVFILFFLALALLGTFMPPLGRGDGVFPINLLIFLFWGTTHSYSIFWRACHARFAHGSPPQCVRESL